MRSLAVVLALASVVAQAQVPQKLGYQGRLLKADGTPEVGIIEFTYTLYDAETGGNVLWSETKKIALTDGFYSTYLGDANELKPDFFDGRELFLEVTAGGDVLKPRQKVASVAYAIRANDARNVVGGTVNASNVSVNGTEVVNSAGQLTGPALAPFNGAGTVNDPNNPVDWSKIKNIPAGFADGVDDGLTGLNVTGPLTSSGGATPTLALTGCQAGELLKWNGTAWACATDNSVQPTGTNGIQVNGSTIALATCQQDFVWRATATGWGCAPALASLNVAAPLTSTGGLNPTIALPTSCANGQVLKWNGSVWACAADTDSGGTVTSVGATAPLVSSGGTTPQLALSGCLNGQILKWNGTAWICAPDADSGGTVTSVTASAPLSSSGGATPNISASQANASTSGFLSAADWAAFNAKVGSVTTGAGSGIAIGGTGVAPIVSLMACSGSGLILKFNGTAWVCAPDDNGGGTVTSVNAAAPLTSTGGGTPTIGLTSGCASGQILKWNGSAWTCAADADTVTTYGAGAGLTLTGNTFSLLAGCNAGQILKWNGSTWACAFDVDTTYSAGSGLSLAGTTFSLSTACASGQLLKWNGSAWTCANDVDTDTNTTYSAGAGLSLSGTTFSLTTGCASGQVLKWNGTTWACANDVDTDTNTIYSAGSGLALTGTTFSLSTSCANGQVQKWNGSAWICANDQDTDTTYTAGSGLSLTGTTFSLPGTCGAGQLLKWNGTAWACANDVDTDTNTTYSAGSGLALTGTTFSLPTNCAVGEMLKWNGTAWACASDVDTNSGGTVTAVTASAPLTSTGGNTPNVAMPKATATADGYLAAADWNAFNSKAGVPSGAVMFFNGTACPTGWVELTAGRGRVIVGLPGSGTLGGTVGAPLANLEDRQHSHTMNHTHGFSGATDNANITGTIGGQTCCGYTNTGAFVTDTMADENGAQYHNHGFSGSTAGPSTGTTGTASTSNIIPYIQLLLCQKT